jgi:hypothetical protein
VREVDKNVFILKVKVSDEQYYLADLNMTLSKNFKDSVIFNNKNSTCAFDGVIEKLLEEKYRTAVTCECIEISMDDILSDGVIFRTFI